MTTYDTIIIGSGVIYTWPEGVSVGYTEEQLKELKKIIKPEVFHSKPVEGQGHLWILMN